MIRLTAAAYLLAGLAATYFCWLNLMMAVWGAPTHWTQYVAVLSGLVLTGGAMTLLVTKDKGQVTCVAGTAGLAFMMVPMSMAVIPAEHIRVNPVAYVFLAIYVALAAAVVNFPERLRFRWAGAVMTLVVLTMVGAAGVMTIDRWLNGEFNRPVIIGFTAERSTAPLDLPANAGPNLPVDLFPATLREEISRTGVGGRLKWSGMIGLNTYETRMVIIVTGPIPLSQQLAYPKQGTIVYVWNGDRWSTIPRETLCHAASAYLLPNGMVSKSTATGGTQRFGMFHWK